MASGYVKRVLSFFPSASPFLPQNAGDHFEHLGSFPISCFSISCRYYELFDTFLTQLLFLLNDIII